MGTFSSFNLVSIGENIAKGNYNDELDLVDGWHNSQQHRENMQGNWTHACTKWKDGHAVTIFMRKEKQLFSK